MNNEKEFQRTSWQEKAKYRAEKRFLRFAEPREETRSSATLLRGFISENPGRITTSRCLNCRGPHDNLILITIHHVNAYLQLYACSGAEKGKRLYGSSSRKCKDVLIRFNSLPQKE